MRRLLSPKCAGDTSRWKRAAITTAAALSAALVGSAAVAVDLGTIGPVYPIQEPDFLAEITAVLRAKERSGELARIQKEAQQRLAASARNPAPVAGIERVTEASTRYHDPTLRFAENIVNERGEIVVPKDTAINPFDQIGLKSRVLFLDARDEAQVAYARRLMNGPDIFRPRLILVGGSPTALSREFGVPVYFDQRGYLTTRLDIQRVPTMISQEGRLLRIDEIPPGG